ncbi:MAG TPA: adenylate kinase [Candidatus Binataceae bacterium]|nr:adenylate kinase [Candidatus Binataceae bacterium]
MRLVLVGPPGSGKGTQARMLQDKLGVPQIASGDLLRTAVHDRSVPGLDAKRLMDRGALVPDEVVLKLIAERLRKPDVRDGFILDGFPRNRAQAEALAKMMENGGALDRVIALNVPDEEIIKRISGRRTCRNCGEMYHLVFDPPTNIGHCNKCNGELYQRDDDSEDTVRNRLQVYAAATRPLLEFYERQGLLRRVDGIGRLEEVEKRILKELGAGAKTPGAKDGPQA